MLLLILATGTGGGPLDHRLRAQIKPIGTGCPTGKPARLDWHGDPLPEGALARLGTVRLRHGQIISGAVFSGDGKQIIASDYYSGVHVWDLATGQRVRRLFTDDHFCHRLAISPDGRTLAVALGDLTVRLCDPSTGREIGSLPQADNRLNHLVFSNDGSLLATGAGGRSVRVWDVATRQVVHRVTVPENVEHVAFSSDGKRLAVGAGKGARLWDLAAGREVRQLRNGPDPKHALAVTFAPDEGPMAVWGYADASVRLLDANGEKEVRRFNPDPDIAAQSPGSWGWASHMLVRFSPDGKTLATVRETGRIDLWDVGTGKRLHALAFDSFRRPSVLAFSPDGTRLASAGSDNWGGDNTIRVWDVLRGQERRPRAGHGSPIPSVAVAPDGHTVATAGQDGVVHLWERSSGKHLLRLDGHRGRRSYVIFSSDGLRLISWGTYRGDGVLWVRDAKTGQAVRRLELPASDGWWETVSADGRTAVSVDYTAKRVRFHDLTTGTVTREVADDFQRPIALSPTADKLVGLDGVLRTEADRKELLNIRGVHTSSHSVRFSADGRTLVAAVVPDAPHNRFLSDPPAEEVVVVDPVRARELRRFGKQDEKSRAIGAVALSPDGRTVVTADRSGRRSGEQVITLWETATGRERGSFVGHIGQVNGLAVSADGRFVVTGADDTTALVWDATDPPVLSTSVRRGPADLAAQFKELAGDNAEQAYVSMWALVRAPNEAVAFLAEQRDLFSAADVEKVWRWIRDLDSNRFAERERASQELGLILDEAESHLEPALRGNLSAEARRRIELLLQARKAGFTGRELQRLRVIEVLEHIARPGADATRLAAIAVLKKLADRPAEAAPTREAKATLERLERPADGKP